MAGKELEFAITSYKILIGLPVTARIRVQKELCEFRDLIADYTGDDAQTVQEKYEHEVHLQQLADCDKA
jgi:hypothetical protein